VPSHLALEKEHDGRDPVPKAMKAKGVVLSNQAACVCACAKKEEEKGGGVDCLGTRCPGGGRKKERVCALLLLRTIASNPGRGEACGWEPRTCARRAAAFA
jgi:hypothetical protein